LSPLFEKKSIVAPPISFLLLGGILIENEAINRVTEILDADDFYRDRTFLHFLMKGMENKPMLMYRLKRQCVKYSPQPGDWRQRVQDIFPFLFWGPVWITWPLYRLLRKSRYIWSLLSDSKNG
jgi:hypothetical protein